jgi:hypothetical protein
MVILLDLWYLAKVPIADLLLLLLLIKINVHIELLAMTDTCS